MTLSEVRSPWWTRRAIAAHVVLAIWIPGCAVAAWWQVRIAEGGNGLGWVYSVMWPCFAIFGVIFWWFLVHDDPDSLGARGLRRQATGQGSENIDGEAAARLATAEAEDPELAAYNEYLAALAQRDQSPHRR